MPRNSNSNNNIISVLEYSSSNSNSNSSSNSYAQPPPPTRTAIENDVIDTLLNRSRKIITDFNSLTRWYVLRTDNDFYFRSLLISQMQNDITFLNSLNRTILDRESIRMIDGMTRNLQRIVNGNTVGGKSKKNYKVQPKLHTGKQGGKYYIKKGKKVYV
jgi:hypothetical protein